MGNVVCDSRYYFCFDGIFLSFLFTASCNDFAKHQISRSLTATYFTFFEFYVAGRLIAVCPCSSFDNSSVDAAQSFVG